jgi:cell wall-associated NlpC family hydrolase
MPVRLRTLFVTLIASLVLAPAASAHHWHGGDWNDPSQDQAWNQPDPAAPTQPQQGPSWGGDNSNWNPSQGDPQESPTNWNQSPPTDNPWSSIPALPVSKSPTVSGRTAMIRRNGLAAIPKGAPARVRAIISAANKIIGKPYKWGGGHGRLFDSGYDCSGSVSYALIRAGLLGYPMVSGSLAHWGARGKGKYVTIYANKGHVYMEVAGLRLDTSSVGDRGGKSGVRWRPPIGKRFGFAVRHVSGL